MQRERIRPASDGDIWHEKNTDEKKIVGPIDRSVKTIYSPPLSATYLALQASRRRTGTIVRATQKPTQTQIADIGVGMRAGSMAIAAQSFSPIWSRSSSCACALLTSNGHEDSGQPGDGGA